MSVCRCECVSVILYGFHSKLCVCVCVHLRSAQVWLLCASADVFSRNVRMWFGFVYKAVCFSAGSQ